MAITNQSLMVNVYKLENVVVNGVNPKDYPDYADAYVESADINGIPLNENELDWLNEHHPEIAHDIAHDI